MSIKIFQTKWKAKFQQKITKWVNQNDRAQANIVNLLYLHANNKNEKLNV
jgi:predicted XRE-type DNA-binding protein